MTSTALEFDELLSSTDFNISTTTPPVEFDADPLELSCASYRAFVENPSNRWADLSTVTVTDSDRTQAQLIRQYYGSKLVMETLMGRTLTAFRAKMGQFLTGHHKITRNEIGMLYKIPYFYIEDTAMDCVIANTETQLPEVAGTPRTLHLTHMSTILKARKHGEMKQYWLVDQQHRAYMMEGPANNALTSLVESLFVRGPVSIVARVFKKAHFGSNRQRYYYMLADVQLAA